jgi:iron(III) transport system permease protein
MPGVQRSAGLLLVPLLAIVALIALGIVSPAVTRQAFFNSAILAAGATVIAVPLGALLAVLIARYDLPGRRTAAACLGVLLFLPLYVQLSGWDAALGKLGWFSLEYGSLAQPLLAGMRGAIFVHGVAAIPWAALIIGLGLAQVDPAQEEAALLVGPPRFVLWRVTWPQTAPFMVAAAIWTIVSTTSEMTVTNIFLINPGERTYTEQFYMTFALSAEPGEATLAVLPGIAGLSLLIAAALWIVVHYNRKGRRNLVTHPVIFSPGVWRPVLMGLLWLTVFALLFVPLASLMYKAGFVVEHSGGERYRSWSALQCLWEIALAPSRFANEFGWTLVVAAGAATIAWCLAILLGWRARRGGWHALPATIISVLGLAIPGPLVGVALIWLMNRDLPPEIPLSDGTYKSWLLVLYDQTPLAPILAQAIRALPLATLLAWHSLGTLDRDVLAAAALDGATPWGVFWRIALPQRWRPLAAAWLAGFAVAAGDLAWAHLVTPPGLDLIQRRVFGLVHSGVEERVAAIALVNVIAYALIAALVLRLLNRKKSRRQPKLF